VIARAGLVLAVLQFAFALTWVVYAAYLPGLAAQVGIAKSVVPWVLLIDQAIFLVCDWLAGVFADRIGDAVARLGRVIALVTLGSCAAFVALPLVAPGGAAPVLVALMVVWSATSSVLRAPTLVLAGRHASRSQRAWLAGLYALGMSAAGIVAPFVGRVLARTEPRVSFVVTSCVVAAMAIVLAAVTPRAPARPSREPVQVGSLAGFVVAIALLAVGFQVHGSMTSSAIYLRYAAREDLASLLPVFWIGCAVAALVVAPLVRRAGGLVVMTGAGVVGAAALLIAEVGGSLPTAVVAQAVAGAAWGAILSAAFAAVTSLGGKAGTAAGLVFSTLAAATVARIAFIASGLAATPGITAVVPFVPAAGWGLGTLVVALLAARRGRATG
jgi:hypothetical protein